VTLIHRESSCGQVRALPTWSRYGARPDPDDRPLAVLCPGEAAVVPAGALCPAGGAPEGAGLDALLRRKLWSSGVSWNM
jgi:hypothetical protein